MSRFPRSQLYYYRLLFFLFHVFPRYSQQFHVSDSLRSNLLNKYYPSCFCIRPCFVIRITLYFLICTFLQDRFNFNVIMHCFQQIGFKISYVIMPHNYETCYFTVHSLIQNEFLPHTDKYWGFFLIVYFIVHQSVSKFGFVESKSMFM